MCRGIIGHVLYFSGPAIRCDRSRGTLAHNRPYKNNAIEPRPLPTQSLGDFGCVAAQIFYDHSSSGDRGIRCQARANQGADRLIPVIVCTDGADERPHWPETLLDLSRVRKWV